MGYLDFDGVRYWDRREREGLNFKPRDEDVDPHALESDASKRTDGILLADGTVEEA